MMKNALLPASAATNGNSASPATCPLCAQGVPTFFCKAELYPGAVRDLFRCAHCDGRYFWPTPSPEEIGRCYPHSYFRDFFKQYWKDYYKGKALVRQFPHPSGSFLDVGCALGTLLAGVRDGSSWSVHGLEYVPAAVEMGRALNRVEIVRGGLTDAPWPDASFDYIHANNVLEHESDPRGALSAAARLLRPGGRLHLTLPNGPVDCAPNQKLFSRGKIAPTRHSGHLFYYSPKSLVAMIERAGLRMLFIRSFHFKTALKAYGWMPNAYRHFEKNIPEVLPPESVQPLEDYKKLIPAQPSWAIYYARYLWRRLWRSRHWLQGYDLEVLAEK